MATLSTAEAKNVRMAENMETFYYQMENESDRGAVIVSAALIDEILLEILKKRLLPSPKPDNDELFKNGSLTDFGARVHLAYRIGLIRKQVKESLLRIARIRNAFAHISDHEGFDNQTTQDHIRELAKFNWDVLQPMSEVLQVNNKSINALIERTGWRSFTQLAFASVATGLALALETVEPIQPLDN